MTLRTVFELIASILPQMRSGEIRLYVKNHEITHVNQTVEIFPPANSAKNRDIIKAKET